jgi:hypothetical protein
MSTLNKRAYLRRIEALKSRTGSTVIIFTMPDNSRKTLRRRRFLEICTEAVNGINSPETAILLSAVADDSGTRVNELLQMLF